MYSVELGAVPSRTWRAAFLRPPTRLTSAINTPELSHLGLTEVTVAFRTAPGRLRSWVRRIDRWIAYANALMVAEWQPMTVGLRLA